MLEVAWAKELTYALGNSIHATATVIAAFMAGLGLGSLAAGRPLFARLAPIRTYALLQLVIGVAGFCSIPLLRATSPLFEFVHQDLDLGPRLFLLARFLVVFPLMAAPATLMGMSLPLVVEARRRDGLDVARNAGLFYGLNTLGAVTGTYLAGFVLIPALGLAKTCAAIGGVDFAVGLVLLALARVVVRDPTSRLVASWSPASARVPLDADAPNADAPVAGTTSGATRAANDRRLFALLFASAGFLSMVYEVAWFRLLANVLGGTVHAFTSMLGIFLVGVGAGSVLGTFVMPRRGSPFVPVVIGLFGIAAGAMSSLYFANALPMVYAELFWAFDGGGSRLGTVAAQGVVAAIVVLPTALLMGTLFPFALRAYEELGAGGQDRRDASEIYGLNTFGGICGSLFAGFWLVPRAGLTITLVVAAIASALLALVVLACLMRQQPLVPRLGLAGAGAALVAVAALLVPGLDHLELHRGVYFRLQASREASRVDDTLGPELRLVYYEEGLNGSVSITEGEDLALHISGKPVATTEFHDRVHLALLGHLPALFAASPQDAAVIGLGSGVALGALAAHPSFESIEVAELEPAVFEVQRYFAAVNGGAIDDPRVVRIAEDGRTHLTWSEKRYDVITSDPISPLIAGAANLYTRDFYALAAERLRPGGVFAQWWQMSGVSATTYENVLATMASVFPHMLVFVYGVDSVVLGSMEPFQVDWAELERRAMVAAVREDLAFYGFDTPVELLGLLWADADGVRRFAGRPTTLSTDDNVWLEHRMPIDHYARRSGPPIPQRLARVVVHGRLEAIEAVVPGLPRRALIEHVVRHPPTSSARVHEAALSAVAARAREVGEAEALVALPEWHEARSTPEREIADFVALERGFEEAMRADDEAKAERFLRAMADRAEQPVSRIWSERLVDWLVRRERKVEALEVLETMRRRFPGRPGIYRRGAELARAVGDAARARRYAEEGALLAGGHEVGAESARERVARARLLVYWAEALLDRGFLERALRHAEDASDQDAHDARARVVRGTALLRLGRHEEAVVAYREAVDRAPERPALHAKLAATHSAMGRSDLALEVLEDAIEALPTSALLRLRAGEIHLGAGRHAEAARHLRVALGLEPRSARVHASWAALLQRRGDLAGSIEHYETALAIDPANAVYHKRLRALRHRLDRRGEAGSGSTSPRPSDGPSPRHG